MPIAMQQNLFGGSTVAGTIVDRLEYILSEYPETRNSYKAAMVRYWLEFDGLEAALRAAMVDVLDDRLVDVLLPGLVDEFVRWFIAHATSPKTLQNRAMELQSEKAELDASEDVRAWREKQSRAGRVK